MEKVKVAIADESSIFCEGLKSVLNDVKDIEVLSCTNDFEKLDEITARYHPQVVLLDYSSARFGEDGIKKFKDKYPAVKLIAITGKQSREQILNALKSGLSSYLLKDCSRDEIVEAVYETANNKQFYCGNVFSLLQKTPEEEDNCDGIALSKREIEIIQHIAEGYTNKEIADQLFISSHTVNTHRKNIMHKLGIRNTAGIVIYAVKENIVTA